MDIIETNSSVEIQQEYQYLAQSLIDLKQMAKDFSYLVADSSDSSRDGCGHKINYIEQSLINSRLIVDEINANLTQSEGEKNTCRKRKLLIYGSLGALAIIGFGTTIAAGFLGSPIIIAGGSIIMISSACGGYVLKNT